MVGLVAGLFAGIFGVGGGIVIVPALVAFAAYPPKTAMATSLGGMLFIVVAAAVVHSQAGNVHFAAAALIGIPAAAGAFGGAWLHQRLDSRRLVLGFAALMVLVAIRLAV